MDSPESTAAVSTSSPIVVQDSPTFSYLSKLSPIKPFNDVCVASAFRELNFPPPSPVSTSPCINRPHKEIFLKRSRYPSPDAGKFSLGYTGSIKELSESTSLFGVPISQSMVELIPWPVKESDSELPAQVQPCNNPSGCVDEFLADPMECVNSSGPSELCLNQAAEFPQSLQDEYTNPNETYKEYANVGPAQSQCFSSSGCINEIRTNPVECDKFTDSPDRLSANDLSQALEIDCTNKEIIVKLGASKGNVKKGKIIEVAEGSTSACQAEEGPTVDEPFVFESLYQTGDTVEVADDGNKNNNRPLNQSSEPVPENANDLMKDDSFLEPASGAHDFQNSLVQTAMDNPPIVPKCEECDSLDPGKEKLTNPFDHPYDAKLLSTESGRWVDWDCTQLQPESLQNVHADNSQHDNSGTFCNIPTDYHISNEQEVLPLKLLSEGCQRQHTMRKYLQFELAGTRPTGIECNESLRKCTTTVLNAESPLSPSNLETLDSTHAESIAASNNIQLSQSANVSEHVRSKLSFCPHQTAETHIGKVDRSVRNNGSSSITVPRPSGIGLNLNSIGRAVANNCNVSMQLAEKDSEKDYLSEQGKKALSQSNQEGVEDSNSRLASITLTGKFSVESTVESDSPLACRAAENNEDNQEENRAMVPPNSCGSFPSPLNVDPLNSSLPSRFIDCYIAPCDKKRAPSEDDCRSDELNELSPRKKRKKAPENGGCKRCNCMRSKCLKLYCDCFTSRLYCAEVCACQGCLNRPEYEDIVLDTRQQKETRNPLAFAPKVVLPVAESPKTSGEDRKRMTPTLARHKRGCNCKKSRCSKKYCECFQAGVGCSIGCRCEGCQNTFGKKDGCVEITEIEHKKAKNEGRENNPFGGMDALKVRNEVLNHEKCLLHLSPLTPLLDGSNGNAVTKYQFPARRYLSSPESAASVLSSYGKSPSCPRNSGNNDRLVKAREGKFGLVPYNQELEAKLDSFSPRWDRFEGICNLSPLPNPSTSVTTFSAVSDARECTNNLQAPLFQGSGRLTTGTLRWRSSPATPMPRFAESKLPLEPDSDCGPHTVHEDDTPDILKDTHMPDMVLKMNSPNKKRVSPPHKCLHEMRSSSSPDLRGGRKFIPKAVPSFPSLTP